MIPIQILEGIVGRSLIWNAILGFFATLDRIAYTIFGWIMQGVFDIANAEIINSSVYDDFQKRVYVILGIFMLFKVTISLLTYLVSPDKISDKERGMSKMVTRTIVVICMLVGLPFAFNLLDKAQPILLEALPRVIIGKNMNIDTSNGQAVSNSINSQTASIADTISWTTFQLSLNDSTVSLLEGEGINTVSGATSVITDPDPSDNSKYKYFYIPVVGTLIAVIMTFLMVGFCIDIAIRSFKLVILRMMAPIPIISYIDPKSAKDGAFSNWTKSLISTWLDLFMRLGILYFVLYMIDEVILSLNFNLDGIGFFRSAVVVLFLIIGLLFFAKQAPKFISDALGIKNSKGLGVGLGGSLAALGAFVGGAGLGGSLLAASSAMNENAEAAAQGKAATASFHKGRDIAEQLKTGDKNAKYSSITQRATEQLARLNARSQGFTDDKYDRNGEVTKKGTITQAKESMYHAKDAASNANILRQKVMDGHALSADDQAYIASTYSQAISKFHLNADASRWSTSDWNNLVNFENTNAAKAEKFYQKAEKYAASRGVRTERSLPDDLGLQNGKFDPNKHNR